jgi:hypothetical protein
MSSRARKDPAPPAARPRQRAPSAPDSEPAKALATPGRPYQHLSKEDSTAMAKNSKKHTRAAGSTPYPGAPPREIAAQMTGLAVDIKATDENANIENGKRLIAAKKLSRERNYHWLPWLKHECGFGERNAQRLMNIAKKSDKFVGLDVPVSALGLLARRSTPDAAISAVAARGQRVPLREVEAIIAAHLPRPVYEPRAPLTPRMVEPRYERREEETPAVHDYVEARHRGLANELERTVRGAAGIVQSENVGAILATLVEKRQRRLLGDAEDLLAALRQHIGRTGREPAEAKPGETKPGENVIQFPTPD